LAAIAGALRRGLPPRSARDDMMRQKPPPPILLDAAGQPMPRNAAPAGRPDRNAPCPCGSGLKFKKCCGRKG
jgi:hypothetical protein